MADIFDRDGDGYIDYYEFVAALHPNKDAYRPTTDADKIEDEVLILRCFEYIFLIISLYCPELFRCSYCYQTFPLTWGVDHLEFFEGRGIYC